jgi:hypothetical protein
MLTKLPRFGTIALAVVATVVLAGTAAVAQEGIVVQPAPTGRLQVTKAGQPIMAIELSVHGDNWTHAPQSRAQAQVTQLADQPGLLYKGLLQVPGGEGPLNFEETLRPAENGFFADYKMWFNQPTTLNGLQVSLLLPVARYLGKNVVLVGGGGRETTVELPMQLDAQKWVLHQGGGITEVQIAPGTDVASGVACGGPTNVLVHDLRQWQQQVFEIRFHQVYQQTALTVEANREFKFSLAFGFQEPVTIQGLAAGG